MCVYFIVVILCKPTFQMLQSCPCLFSTVSRSHVSFTSVCAEILALISTSRHQALVSHLNLYFPFARYDYRFLTAVNSRKCYLHDIYIPSPIMLHTLCQSLYDALKQKHVSQNYSKPKFLYISNVICQHFCSNIRDNSVLAPVALTDLSLTSDTSTKHKYVNGYSPMSIK